MLTCLSTQCNEVMSSWPTVKASDFRSTALRSNFDPSHFKNKKCLYELFFQHFFQISRNQRMEIQNHQPEKCLVFKKYLKKCYFQTIEVLEIPWVKIATESCVVVVRFESTPNFVVDDCKPFCNFNFVVVRIKSAPNFIVEDCNLFCNLTHPIFL